MKLTEKKLKKMRACQSGIDWVKEQSETDARKLIKLAMKEGRFDDCNWYVTRMMNHEQCIRYAVYAAGLVIKIFEKRYPDDTRPRKAIQAAKRFLKDPTKQNRTHAAHAANDSADSAAHAAHAAYAAYSAADAAAYSAGYAAHAAYSAADANDAAYAAANDSAAYSAADVNDAAYAAANDSAAYSAADVCAKCINYALRLLKAEI